MNGTWLLGSNCCCLLGGPHGNDDDDEQQQDLRNWEEAQVKCICGELKFCLFIYLLAKVTLI